LHKVWHGEIVVVVTAPVIAGDGGSDDKEKENLGSLKRVLIERLLLPGNMMRPLAKEGAQAVLFLSTKT
jgi:hypothetical protein